MNRTLAEIRSDIQVRLGFGMAGQAGVVNSPLIDSMIRNAQDQLYQQYDWLQQKGYLERLTGQQQQFYDYPADCEPERLRLVCIKDSGFWRELREGIRPEDRSSTVQRNVPLKFDRAAQVELWPVPNQQYSLRFDYIKTLSPLTSDSHRTTIDDGLVFLHALANAKLHYRQPDASTYATQLDNMLTRLKARNRGQSVWSKSAPAREPFEYPPQ